MQRVTWGAVSRVSGVPHVLPLDGLRGVAILIVIVHNAEWIAGSSSQFALKLIGAISASGWVGVQLFFVLSGYLITGILLDSKGSPAYFRSFYARRALRIFPLYYGVLAIAFGVGPWLAWSNGWAEAVHRYQWMYWAYLANWFEPFGRGVPGLSHFWSLAVEEQFYLAWPLVVLLASRRRLMTLCLALIVLTPFIRLLLNLAGLPAEAGYMFTIARWDALAAGAFVAVGWRDDRLRATLVSRQRLLLGCSLGLLLAQTLWQHGFHQDDLPTQVLGQSLVLILCLGLIVTAIDDGPSTLPGLRTLLVQPWLRAMGRYSYAMYIFHFPLHQALSPILGQWVQGGDTPWRIVRIALYIGLVFCLTFAMAWLSWRLIESPFLRLKDRLAPRPA